MRIKDYKEGMIAGAKLFEERFLDLQADNIAALQKNTAQNNETIKSLIDGQAELDNKQRFDVDLIMGIDELEETHKKIFSNFIYTLSTEFPSKNNYQKEFIKNTLTWFGNGKIPQKIELNKIDSIDNLSYQKLLFSLFFVYFSLSEKKRTTKELEVLDLFSISKKNRDEISSTISDLVKEFGPNWLVQHYTKENLNTADNCFQIAKIYFNKKEYDLCIEWLNYVDDNSDALYLLGECYENGIADIEKAKFYYQKAAEKNNISAQLWMGNYYSNTISENNAEEAFYWYLKAANQNNGIAQFSIGMHYLRGAGVSEDKNEAYTWFRKAIKNGFEEAFYGLGLIYEDPDYEYYDIQNAIACYFFTNKTSYRNKSEEKLINIYRNGNEEIKTKLKDDAYFSNTILPKIDKNLYERKRLNIPSSNFLSFGHGVPASILDGALKAAAYFLDELYK